MKKIYIFLFLLVLLQPVVQAASLDGRSTPTYIETSMNSFTSGNSAKGWVYFKKGFKVPSGGTLNVNLSVPVNGDIDLNNGRLILDNDLRLSSSARLTGSGLIEGNGHAIHLSTSLIITSTISFELPDKDNKIIINGHDKIIALNGAGSLNFGGDASSFMTTVTFVNTRICGVHTHDPTGASILTNTGSFRNGVNTRFTFQNTVLDVINTLSLRATTTIAGRCIFQTRRSGGPYRIIKSGTTLGIADYSTLEIGQNEQCIFAHEEEIIFGRSTSVYLRLNSCILTTKTRNAIKLGGLAGTRLNLFIDGVVQVQIPGGDLVFSRVTPAFFDDSIKVDIFPASSFVLSDGTRLVYNDRT